MSMLPLMFSNWWEDLRQPHRLGNQDFGLVLNPDLMLSPAAVLSILANQDVNPRCPIAPDYKLLAELLRKNNQETGAVVKDDKDKFQVVLDVQQFSPDEINVKVVDRFVVVEGKHDEKRDEHGWISRQFTRRYLIPDECDIDQITPKLSSDGVLSISVPRKQKEIESNERVIKIERTGKPAAAIREPVSEKKASTSAAVENAEEETKEEN